MADLLDLLTAWNEATLALTQCRESCVEDADYFCWSKVQAEREARQAFYRELFRLMDEPGSRDEFLK